MNKPFTLERAVAWAARAHEGQVDKAGAPYILHPLRVMMALEDPLDRIVAVLHDVVEDTDTSIDQLRTAGLDDRLAVSLALLTHKPGVPYLDYVRAIAADDRARRIKIADLSDNMNLDRLPEITPADEDRRSKYQQALTILVA